MQPYWAVKAAVVGPSWPWRWADYYILVALRARGSCVCWVGGWGVLAVGGITVVRAQGRSAQPLMASKGKTDCQHGFWALETGTNGSGPIYWLSGRNDLALTHVAPPLVNLYV